MIGWGGTYPTATEVDPLGNVAMELSFLSTSATFSYRTFKFAVDGLGASTDVQKAPLMSENRLYPNPNNGNFIVDTRSTGAVALNIYNVSGQLILQKTINGQQTISGLPVGVYSAVFKSNGNTSVQRFVVQ